MWFHSATHGCINPRKIGQKSLKNTEHPPYSPDLSPCDYHMFGPLREEMGGHHFDDDDVVETFVNNWLQTRTDSFYDDRINSVEKNLWIKDEIIQKNMVYSKFYLPINVPKRISGSYLIRPRKKNMWRYIETLWSQFSWDTVTNSIFHLIFTDHSFYLTFCSVLYMCSTKFNSIPVWYQLFSRQYQNYNHIHYTVCEKPVQSSSKKLSMRKQIALIQSKLSWIKAGLESVTGILMYLQKCL